MRILHDSDERLSIRTRRSWLVMIVGVLMVVMAACLVLGPAKKLSMDFKHTPSGGFCALTETKLLTTSRYVRIPLTWMRGAEATPKRWSEGRFYYHLNFDVTDGDGAYYVTWYGDKAQAEADAAAINRFLADPAIQTMSIEQDRRQPYLVIAGLLGFFGLVFVLWGSMRIQATFNRLERQVRVTRSGLMGVWNRDVAWDEIQAVDVAGLGGDCQLYMVLRSGRRVDLSTSTDTEGLMSPRLVREHRLRDAARLREYVQIG